MHACLTQVEKTETVGKARSSIILCLRDKVIRKVVKEKIAALKLESLYMTKSLARRSCLKQQIYSFQMVENKYIVQPLIKIHKIINDLENIEEKNEDECWTCDFIHKRKVELWRFEKNLLKTKSFGKSEFENILRNKQENKHRKINRWKNRGNKIIVK